MTPQSLKLEAQAALDELTQEGRLPFPLEAREMTLEEGSRYTVSFHDSRLPSVTVACGEGQSFKNVVHAAVLDKASHLSGIWFGRV